MRPGACTLISCNASYEFYHSHNLHILCRMSTYACVYDVTKFTHIRFSMKYHSYHSYYAFRKIWSLILYIFFYRCAELSNVVGEYTSERVCRVWFGYTYTPIQFLCNLVQPTLVDRIWIEYEPMLIYTKLTDSLRTIFPFPLYFTLNRSLILFRL